MTAVYPIQGVDVTARMPMAQASARRIRALASRDYEVRAHERTHKVPAGDYVGAISYEPRHGPDGQRYATGGEMPRGISPEAPSDAALRKLERARAGALAPANPTSPGRRIDSAAGARAVEARAEIARASSQDFLPRGEGRYSGETAATGRYQAVAAIGEGALMAVGGRLDIIA